MLKKIDVFPKFSDQDLRIKTNSGALLSVITFLMMAIMFFHEFYRFVKPRVFDEVSVDTSRVGLMRTMSISFNLTIALPCTKIHINAYDYEGKQQNPDRSNIKSQRIDQDGLPIGSESWIHLKIDEKKRREMKKLKEMKEEFNDTYCGSCYGAAETVVECCNSCDDVIEKFKKKGLDFSNQIERWEQCVKEGYANFGKESCNIYGETRVSRNPGTLYFALEDNARPGQKKMHDISRISQSTNLSHTIHFFEFGTHIPGLKHPLDNTKVIMNEKGKLMYNYLIQVVPNKWRSSLHYEVNTYKYHPILSIKNLTAPKSREVPGIFFKYDISPISVISTETKYSIWRFITSICAIVGGAFTCANLFDQLFYQALSTLEGKRNIGKDL